MRVVDEGNDDEDPVHWSTEPNRSLLISTTLGSLTLITTVPGQIFFLFFFLSPSDTRDTRAHSVPRESEVLNNVGTWKEQQST